MDEVVKKLDLPFSYTSIISVELHLETSVPGASFVGSLENKSVSWFVENNKLIVETLKKGKRKENSKRTLVFLFVIADFSK